jgi:hypothetical protein
MNSVEKTLNFKNLKRKWIPEFAARCLGKGSDGLAAHPCLIHLQRVSLFPPLRSWEMTRYTGDLNTTRKKLSCEI